MKEHEIAIEWWKEILRKQPMRNALGKTRDKHMEFTQVLGTVLGYENTPSEEQLERFGKNLWFLLQERKVIVEETQIEFPDRLSCDYQPDAFLGSAAHAAGISSHAFPWKTVMWIKEGHVSVRHGYGAKVQILYETKEYHLKDLEFRIGYRKQQIHSYKGRSEEWAKEMVKEYQDELPKLESELKQLRSTK